MPGPPSIPRLQEIVDWAEENGACPMAVAAHRAYGDLSIPEWVTLIRESSEEDFPILWSIWAYNNFGQFLDNSRLTLFVERIALDPLMAAHAFVDLEFLTPEQEVLLLKSFHSEHRADGKRLFPRIERELGSGAVKPVKRKRRP